MADFSSKTVEFSRKWNGFFKMLKEKNYLIYIAQKLKIKKDICSHEKVKSTWLRQTFITRNYKRSL